MSGKHLLYTAYALLVVMAIVTWWLAGNQKTNEWQAMPYLAQAPEPLKDYINQPR